MKYIIFKSETDSLNTFAHLIADGLIQAGRKVLLADMRAEDHARNEVMAFTEPGNTVAFFLNHTGLNLLTKERDSIWNTLNVDCYDFIVDHPMYYHPALIFPIRRLTFLCVDLNHIKFIRRFYPKVKCAFFPHAGIVADQPAIPFEERSMDILFTGAYLIDDSVEFHTQGLGGGLAQVWRECFEMLKKHTHYTLEQAVETCFCEKGIQLPQDDLRDTVRLFRDMDGMIRSYARSNVVKILADHDIKLHVYGEGWERLDCKQENLTVHSRIPFDETIPLMADAKIVLNVMPWFKAGIHDRVFSAMLNQSVCLTDSSEYMARFLEDGKNAILFSLDQLKELPEKLKHYLQRPQLLKEIAACGYKYAKDTQTWQARAQLLIEIAEHSEANAKEGILS